MICRDAGIRTRDPLTPSGMNPGNPGQRETAALFSQEILNPRQLQETRSRYRLSGNS
jgi:hypothetical protein